MRPRVGRDERHVPPVGVLRDEAQRHLLAAAADPDREPGLHGFRFALRVGEREELAREVGAFLAQQAAHAHETLFEDAQPSSRARERDAVRVVFELGPARAQPESDPARGELVECGHRVREHRGVAVPGAVDEAAAPHAVRVRRERGVAHERFEARRVAGVVGRVEVVPDRDPVEAELLDALPERAQLAEASCSADLRAHQNGPSCGVTIRGGASPRAGEDHGTARGVRP